MARATTAPQTITNTWVQVANLGETWVLTVNTGDINYAWSSASPGVTILGHILNHGESTGDTATTENLWVRSTNTRVNSKITGSKG